MAREAVEGTPRATRLHLQGGVMSPVVLGIAVLLREADRHETTATV
ncbi:hypothetical protein [Acetobacter indonesiensis]|nr:hypothetical protein [Acetobacter indonesiensis]